MLKDVTLIEGLQPPIDRRRVQRPYVVDGKNFIVDIDGPVSGLGTEWFLDRAFKSPIGAQILPLRDEANDFYFAADGIYRLDFATKTLFPVFRHGIRQLLWPWSRAVCGTRVYFANREIGLLEYNDATNRFTRIDTGSVIIGPVIGCTNSGGRLVVVTDRVVHWSEIDNGSEAGFVTSTTTGAGFQALSFLSAGAQPLGVFSYSDGVIVYTNRGLLRGELVLAINPFRWTNLSTEHNVLNPWCIQILSETNQEQHIFLTARGFFITSGANKPQLWQPVMSEHLHRNVIPGILSGVQNMTFRLSQNFERGWIVLSIAETSRQAFYTKALLFYVPTAQWGSYDFSHVGFDEFQFDATATTRDFAVISADGSVLMFGGFDANRTFPVSESIVLFSPMPTPQLLTSPDPAIPTALNTAQAQSFLRLSAATFNNTHQFLTALPRDDGAPLPRFGAYEPYFLFRVFTPSILTPVQNRATGSEVRLFAGGSQSRVVPNTFDSFPLQSFVVVGPFFVEPREQGQVDQLSQLQTALVGMFDGIVEDTFEDWNIEPVDDMFEDWNIGPDVFIDWGQFAGTTTEYLMSVSGTIDGYNVWEDNELVPVEVTQTGRTKFFAGTVTGMFLYLRFDAQRTGDIFHVKYLRLDLFPAGRVF